MANRGGNTSTQIEYPLDYAVPHASVDVVYGPYNSVEEAKSATAPQNIGGIQTPGYRSLGLTVGVVTNGSIKEYWWKDGLGDNDLVEKKTGTDITVDSSVTPHGQNPVTSEAIYNFVDSYMGDILEALMEI